MKMIADVQVEELIMNINKNTKIYGSFSSNPGNFGCEFHNEGFQKLGIDAIYKSFKIQNIEQAIGAMKTLDIQGVGISMPFKKEVINYVDITTSEIDEIGAVNTLVNEKGSIVAYNTDYIAASSVLAVEEFEILYILGNGGYSKAVQYACKLMGKKFQIITRSNWDKIHSLDNALIFNCTPVEKDFIRPPESCKYIDCLISTQTGQTLSTIQAAEQFRLYTGQQYPCRISSSA